MEENKEDEQRTDPIMVGIKSGSDDAINWIPPKPRGE